MHRRTALLPGWSLARLARTIAIGLLSHGVASPAAMAAAVTTAPATAAPALEVNLQPLPGPDGQITAVEVTLDWTFPPAAAGVDGDGALLRMPHVVSNVDTVAREIELHASDSRGAVTLTASDQGIDAAAVRHWRADRKLEGALRLRYRAAIHNRLATRGAAPPFELRSEAGAFSGAGLAFLLLPESDVPHRLSLRWDLAALPAGARGVSSVGVGDVELGMAVPPALLARSFYMAGRVGLQPEDATGRGFFGAWMGEPPFDARELLAWTGRLFTHYGRFFGSGDGEPRYGVFLRRNLVNPGGGVGLQDSFVGTFDTGLDVEDFRLTLAHEMFHTRSPYIVAPPGLASQWFPEGLAVFYQRVLPRRFGMLGAQGFIDDVNYYAGRYFTNLLGDVPYAQVPLRFWEDTRIRTIPYDRGSFYFVILDQALRRHSGGHRSLDDLVMEMRRRERGGAKLSMAAWEALLRAELGAPAVRQFRGMLAGEWQLPSSDAFGPCFRRTRVKLRRYELGFEPKVLTEQPRIVRGLVAGSAAERAGLRNGDEILRPVGQDAIQGDQARELELQLRREGRDWTLRYLPRGATVDAWQWQRKPSAGDASCRD